jgi:cytochrome c oxidase assembly protein subunit 11
MYLASVVVGAVGMSYAAVPLYKAFCQATGYGGTTQVAKQEKLATLVPVAGAREITITFNAEVSDALPWTFVPQSKTIKVVPGETALAFYTATNKSKDALIGVSTYNVLPMKAGVHFNKIQCFCFDEQRLQPEEEVDMPVRLWSARVLSSPFSLARAAQRVCFDERAHAMLTCVRLPTVLDTHSSLCCSLPLRSLARYFSTSTPTL